MPVDQDLLEDTLYIKNVLQMDMIGNDYIVAKDGSKYLLEVNHIPNITRFEEVRQVYLSTVIEWIN
jgi:D-alanine-D-alanine ligase-like ATP-grasp enzyme